MPLTVPSGVTAAEIVRYAATASPALSPSALTFPSSPLFWAQLLKAMRENREEAQRMPLFVVYDEAHKESVKVSRAFFRDFVEEYETERTHIVTVTAPDSVVTFRAVDAFWNHAELAARSCSLSTAADDPACGRGIVTVRSNLRADSVDNILVMSRDAWDDCVASWNGKHQRVPQKASASSSDDLRALLSPTQAAMNMPRARANATIDPFTTKAAAEEFVARSTRVHGSRYYSYFMKHWKVLCAQNRNYL